MAKSPSPGASGGIVNGDAVYLRAITENILGWSNPKARLQKALTEDHFLLFAQRILPLKPRLRDQACLEILLRLQEEEDNMLPPGGFFPVAESLGMLEDIDRWVVRHTTAWCEKWIEHENAPMCCINLSTDALLNPEFSGFVRTQIKQHDVNGSRLCFEIAESDAIAHPEAVRKLIRALKPRGCRFTLDNFGSVKVSFAHIKDLPIDYLKIDGSIIQNIITSPGDFARARAISLTCQRLGIRAIAQSVESKAVLTKLTEIGFDYAQGFGISHPGPLAKIRC
jgi:EAL domain-containing protein (putative c-di-GMP-specific phosphodiesterase class I)